MDICRAKKRHYHFRQEQQQCTEIATHLSKDNNLKWNPRDTCDDDTFEKILSKYNTCLKEEPVEKYNTSDFIVENSISLKIDTTSLIIEDGILSYENTRWYFPTYLLKDNTDFPQEECENWRVLLPKLSKNSGSMAIQSNNIFGLVKNDTTHSKSYDCYEYLKKNHRITTQGIHI